jgi:N6-L-threonylcarbamoyladenine synthase
LCLIVSAGHTGTGHLVKDHGHYEHLGGTQDDAAGEAFRQGGPPAPPGYPGGPAIQQAAAGGNAKAYPFAKAKTDAPTIFRSAASRPPCCGAATVQPRAGQPRQRG